MQIKFGEVPEFVEYFLVEGAVKLQQILGKDLSEIWPEMFDGRTIKNKEWDLTVTFNGIELPTLDIFKHIDSQIEEFVVKKAIELVREKCGDINDLIYDLEHTVVERIKKDYPKFRLEEDY